MTNVNVYFSFGFQASPRVGKGILEKCNDHVEEEWGNSCNPQNYSPIQLVGDRNARCGCWAAFG